MTAPAVYTRQGHQERDRNEWLTQHAPLVKRIAHHMLAKLPAPCSTSCARTTGCRAA